MVVDSTNLVLLFVICGGLAAALFINALRLRRQDGNAAGKRNIGESDAQSRIADTLESNLWRRMIMIVVLGAGMLLLLPIATALRAGEPDAANRVEAFVRTLVFLVPFALCVFYGRRSGRPELK